MSDFIENINLELSRESNLFNFLESLTFDFSITDYITEDDLESIEDYCDLLEGLDRSFDENSDIIYYYNAIEYLKENDPSLVDSLAIASDLGYSIDTLNSERLASLLKASLIRSEFEDSLKDRIVEFFDYIDHLEFGT
jgi:hypothetical protein